MPGASPGYPRSIPGVSAMQAAAARLGAPLGHDFCAISLSDNLKPWEVVERRLQDAAAEGDFVIALYNPASKARPDRIHQAFALLRGVKAGDDAGCFCSCGWASGRSNHADDIGRMPIPGIADMSTLVMIGSSETRFIERPRKQPWLLTPRTYGAGR